MIGQHYLTTKNSFHDRSRNFDNHIASKCINFCKCYLTKNSLQCFKLTTNVNEDPLKTNTFVFISRCRKSCSNKLLRSLIYLKYCQSRTQVLIKSQT